MFAERENYDQYSPSLGIEHGVVLCGSLAVMIAAVVLRLQKPSVGV